MFIVRHIIKMRFSISYLALPLVYASSAAGQIDSDTPDSRPKRHNEYVVLEGHTVREDYSSPLPHTYINDEDLPVSQLRQI